MGKREENRRQRFESIHRHSFQILEEEGVEGLTIQRLAREMSWALGAVYRYYPSKEALLAALEHEAVAHVMDFLLENEGEASDPLEGIRLLAARYAALPDELPQEFALVCLMLGDPRPHLPMDEATKIMEAVMPFLNRVASLFEEAQGQGLLKPIKPMDATLVYWMTVHGNTLIDKLDRFDDVLFSRKRLIPLAVDALLAGWTHNSLDKGNGAT
jgi:AcrR family transcriptional regulator